jgi:hypothetical protein
MPSPVYQNMVILIVDVPIWRGQSIFMNVAMWEHRTFDNETFRCGIAFHYLNYLSFAALIIILLQLDTVSGLMKCVYICMYV